MKDLCVCGQEKDRRAKNCRFCASQKLRTNFTCSVDGCEKDAWSGGLCPMHLRRFNKYGDVEKVTRGPESGYWNFRIPITPDSYNVCWEWTGYLYNRGIAGREYGGVFFEGKRCLVHRLAWEAINGLIPTDKELCHKCDNPKCWRPDHLFLGTHKENMEDMAKKGRRPNKLSDEKVQEIQSVLSERGPNTSRKLQPSNSKIAEQFGVNRTIIDRIESGTRISGMLERK